MQFATAACVGALLLAAACGADSSGTALSTSTTAAASPFDLPTGSATTETSLPSSIPATVPASTTTTTAAAAVVDEPAAERELVASQVTNGVWAQVFIREGPVFAADDVVSIEVLVENQTDGRVFFPLDQLDTVVFFAPDRSTVRWRAYSCNPTAGDTIGERGAGILEAGEQIPTITRYPQPAGPRDMDCALPPGEYVAVGLFTVCKAGREQELRNSGTYDCAKEDRELIASGGLPITITD